MGRVRRTGGVSDMPTEGSIVTQVCTTETMETYR